MKLAVFDVDGTLTSTFAVDEECFAQAFGQSLGIDTLNTNWWEYEHVTDSGILGEAFSQAFGRAPSSTEIARFIESFVDLLSQHYRASNDRFGEIPGAGSLIRGLRIIGRTVLKESYPLVTPPGTFRPLNASDSRSLGSEMRTAKRSCVSSASLISLKTF